MRQRSRPGPCEARRAPARRGKAPQPLFVATALGDDLLAPLPLEIAPLADEDRRHIELLGDDPKMRPQREADLLGGQGILRERVETCMERAAPSRIVS